MPLLPPKVLYPLLAKFLKVTWKAKVKLDFDSSFLINYIPSDYIRVLAQSSSWQTFK